MLLRTLTVDEMVSGEEPAVLWRALWNDFPGLPDRVAVHSTVRREAGRAAARGGRSRGRLAGWGFGRLQHLYQDAPTFRFVNLLLQKTVSELVRRLPGGRALRVLEIGGGAGGTTGFILSVLPEHCTEYVFTDASERFTTNAQHKFAQYPFAQFRTLDLARSPLEQGFDLNSFDLIIASGGLHAAKDLRKTLDHVKQLLGSAGMLAIAEPTHPWLYLTLICGLPKGWAAVRRRRPTRLPVHLPGELEQPAARRRL